MAYHTVWSEICGWHHSQCACPEPTINVEGFEPISITTFNFSVTKSTSIMNISDVWWFHETFNEVLFSFALKTDHVHAHFTAIISASEPIPTSVSESGFITCPWNPVTFASKSKVASCKFKAFIILTFIYIKLCPSHTVNFCSEMGQAKHVSGKNIFWSMKVHKSKGKRIFEIVHCPFELPPN